MGSKPAVKNMSRRQFGRGRLSWRGKFENGEVVDLRWLNERSLQVRGEGEGGRGRDKTELGRE